MQNPIQKFRQSYCFRKTRYFVRKFENFDELQLPYSSIFSAETSHAFPTYQCPQCLELNIRKDLVSTHPIFTLLSITQDVNKIKKIPTHAFVGITK